MKKGFIYKYLICSFIYLEIAFRVINELEFFSISTLFACLCATILAIVVAFFIDLLKFRWKVRTTALLLFIFGIYFSAHTCLYKFYKFYFQFSSLQLLDQVAAFASDGLQVFINNLPIIIAFLSPFFVFLFLKLNVDFNRTKITVPAIVLAVCLLIYMPFVLDPYGYVYKIVKTNNMIPIINGNGVFGGLIFDIDKTINGEEYAIDTEDSSQMIIDNNESGDIEYAYNAFDIDFDELNANTSNSAIKELNNYFASKTPTKQNEYTSFFEGKNLILFMAESFNGIAVNEELTPTLYKLVHSGFEFTNFYTPTNLSTIGGEFTELTSLIPSLNPTPSVLGIFRSGTNSYPMGIANLFKEAGYKEFAYHDSTYSFQDRDAYLKSLGFDNYKACSNGLEKVMACRWPSSDSEMIDVTFNDYINENKFIVFYASVSGHGPYTFSDGSKYVAKYKDELISYYGETLYKDEVGRTLMAYEAGQIELDRALEALLRNLEESGKLADTVIALCGDHHPYYLTEKLSMDQYNRLSTYERDGKIELYHSNFILYNSEMETVTIDKVGSSLDVIPTIYNLFGMDYDSRFLMGTDLLSSTPSIAVMADSSWVTDFGKYYSNTGKFEANSDLPLGDSYVSYINTKVRNMQNISKMIMSNNYYKYIYDNKKD